MPRITPEQFKFIRNLLHPDRIQDAAQRPQFTEAFALFNTLEDVAVQPQARTTKPFDYTKVTTAVTLYAQDKKMVTVNKTIKAVYDLLPELREPDQELFYRYVFAGLRALGFKPSKSGDSYSR